MELEIAKLLLRRCARHPILPAVWLCLAALPWAVAVLGPLGPGSRSLFSPRIAYEVAFLWGLIGAVVALATLGSIDPWLETLGRTRRLRAQATTLLACVLVPALPLVGSGLLPAPHPDVGGAIGRTVAMAIHLVALGLVTAQVSPGPVRSIAFLSLAWLIPALVSVPIRGIVVPVLDATRHLEATSGSPAWPAASAPILALVLMAIGVDGIRRPAS